MTELKSQATLQISHHLFAIVDGETPEIPTAEAYANGLVEPVKKGACIETGIRSGPVRVTVSIRDDRPAEVEQEWDEIVEVSVRSRKGDLNIRSIDDWPDLPTVSVSGAGSYRIRVHARGRDVEAYGYPSQPTEHYLLQVWPAPTAEPTIFRQSDEYGLAKRQSAAGQVRTQR